MSTILGSLNSSTDFSDIAEVISMTNSNSTNADNITTLNGTATNLAVHLTAAEINMNGVISDSANNIDSLKSSIGDTSTSAPTTLKQIPTAIASINSTVENIIGSTDSLQTIITSIRAALIAKDVASTTTPASEFATIIANNLVKKTT